MKKIMILGAGILQLPAIVCAKKMGIKTIAVDMDPNAIGFKYADVCLPISTIDIDRVVAAAKEQQIDGVMTLASDMPMRTVAAVAKELNLSGIDKETALKATNKYEMRKAFSNNAVPIPKFYRVSNFEEFNGILCNFKGKFIVKPADNSGSRGIFMLEDSTDHALCEKAFKHSKSSSRNGDIVVEEYMEGPEVSVEALTVDGVTTVLQITDKLTTGAPFFVEMGHSQPANFPCDVIEKIKEAAIAAVKAVGIKNGPSHTEIKVTEEGPKIVELGARLGGDCITTHLVPLSTGIDMVECTIRIALGEKVELTPKFSRGSAIRYIDSTDGILREISGLEDAKKIPNVKQIEIVKEIGSPVTQVQSSCDRLGFVIADAETASEAVAICEAAKERIKVKID